jgi:dephospho-CoA kinase
MQRPVVVAFCGGVGSGKTKLSKEVASELRCRYVGFGDWVRSVALGRRLPVAREALQELGASLIAELGLDGFCRSALAHGGWACGESVVIDGVRHLEILETLRRLVAPSRVNLVFVQVDWKTQEERLRQRGSVEPDLLSETESHPTEVQVASILAGAADLVVDGTKCVAELREQIIDWLSVQV